MEDVTSETRRKYPVSFYRMVILVNRRVASLATA